MAAFEAIKNLICDIVVYSPYIVLSFGNVTLTLKVWKEARDTIETLDKTVGVFVVTLLSNALVRETQTLYLDELGRHELHDHQVFAFVFLILAFVLGLFCLFVAADLLDYTHGGKFEGKLVKSTTVYYCITIGILISQAITIRWLQPHEEKCNSRWIASDNGTGTYMWLGESGGKRQN